MKIFFSVAVPSSAVATMNGVHSLHDHTLVHHSALVIEYFEDGSNSRSSSVLATMNGLFIT